MPDHIPEERNLPMYALIYNCTTDAAVLKGYVHEQQTSKQERDAVKEFSSRLEAVEKDPFLKECLSEIMFASNERFPLPEDKVLHVLSALTSLVPTLSPIHLKKGG